MAREGGGNILPMKLFEKCDGQKVWILMQDNKEISGRLKGHDENFNMIIEEVKEYESQKLVAEYEVLLLNGQRVQVIIPGSEPDYD